MLRTAFDWLIENRAGTAEIWLASDGQRSNWLPDDPRWKNVIAQLGGLSQRVRVRLLAMNQPSEANASISIRELLRRPRGDKSELQFVLDLQRNRSSTAPVPVTLTLNGERSETDVALEGQSLRWRHKIDLGARREGGWGSFALPTDGNMHDNTAYFVYGADTPFEGLVEAETQRLGKTIRAAEFELLALGFGSADLRQRRGDRRIISRGRGEGFLRQAPLGLQRERLCRCSPSRWR